MVGVLSGEFWMGSDEADFSDARPQHRVYMDGFWMDKTEVTNEQFEKFVNATLCHGARGCGLRFGVACAPLIGLKSNTLWPETLARSVTGFKKRPSRMQSISYYEQRS
jgi:formylglycine-generating enzyme required for sulfatase activity